MLTMSQAAANLSPLLYNPEAPVIGKFSGKWRFLSNPFPASVTFGGLEYATSEHAFHALKNSDPAYRAAIAALPADKWRQAKDLGRKVDLRPDWDASARHEAMAFVLRAKFLVEERRTQALLSTGASLLIEGTTWHDGFWGDCSCGRPACAAPGENHLGRHLMALRSEVRANTSAVR